MSTYSLLSSQTVQAANGQGLYLNTGALGGTGTVVTIGKLVCAINYQLTVGSITTPIPQACGKIVLNVFCTPYTITGTSVISQSSGVHRFEIPVPPVSGYVTNNNFGPFIAEGTNVWCWVDVRDTNIACTLTANITELNV